MMSTPISKLPGRDDDDSIVDSDSDVSTDAGGEPDRDHQESVPQPAPKARKARGRVHKVHWSDGNAARRSARRRNADGAGEGFMDTSTEVRSTYVRRDDTPVWKAMLSRPFAQAIVLSFAIILATFTSPIASMLIDRVPAISKMPHADTILAALVAAILVTVTRPPPVPLPT